jgi:hypothetical protein
MKKFALVAENGEVVSIVHPAYDNMFTEGQQVGTQTAHSFAYEMSDTTVMNEWYWRYAWVKNKPARPGNYYYWDNYEWNLNTEALVTEMRSLRDYKLGRSDWTQVADSPLADTDKAAWATYRQALRDVPANNPDVTSLDEVSWPTKPGG